MMNGLFYQRNKKYYELVWVECLPRSARFIFMGQRLMVNGSWLIPKANSQEPKANSPTTNRSAPIARSSAFVFSFPACYSKTSAN
jgi:hypothetical protein